MFLRPLVHLHGSIVMQYSVILFIIMYVCRTEYYMFKSFPLQFYSYSKYQLYDDKLDLNSKMIFFQILTKNWTMVSFFESNQDKIRPLCAMQQHSWCWYAAVVLNEVFVSWSKAIQTFSSHFSLVRNLYHRELIFGRVIYVQFYLHFKMCVVERKVVLQGSKIMFGVRKWFLKSMLQTCFDLFTKKFHANCKNMKKVLHLAKSTISTKLGTLYFIASYSAFCRKRENILSFYEKCGVVVSECIF